MRTELPRRFFDGFVLASKDLEEIHDLLVQRMEGVGPSKNQYTTKYELRFKYGAIQQRASVHDILKEANGGELTIEGLNISLEDKSNPQDRTITLQFSNIKNLPNPISIYYNIVGTDEGWVNDTDTQLAIKIKGVKRFSFDRLNRRYSSSGGLIIFLLIFLTILNLLFLLPYPFVMPLFYLPFLGSLMVIFLVIIVIVQLGRFFFPSYNFCWGTYEKSFKRRRAIGIWIIVVACLGTLLSVLANFISVRIGIH